MIMTNPQLAHVESIQDPFQKLCAILDTLLGPQGCPWDREQTMLSLRHTLLEEAHEVIDAINSGDAEKIREELGDLFLNAVFLTKLGVKEGRFAHDDPLREINAKLIRRHPHVFGEIDKGLSAQGVFSQWEAIKQAEKKKPEGPFDSIPRELPSLARAQKVLKKLRKMNVPQLPKAPSEEKISEEELGRRLMELVAVAEKSGIDAEQALLTATRSLQQQV